LSRPILIARDVALATPLVALLAALPAALRLTAAGFGFVESWFAVAALTSVPMGLLLAAARMARRSLDAVVLRRRPLLIGLVLWLAMFLVLDTALGAVLKATTHHRGLAGATFGALAFGAGIAAALLARPIATSLGRREGAIGTVLNVCLALATAFVCLVIAWAAYRGAARSVVLDATLPLVACLLASRWDLPGNRATPAAVAGSLVLAGVVTWGALVLVRSPALVHEVAERAPLAGAIGQTVGLPGS
jgi:hypothetical protein